MKLITTQDIETNDIEHTLTIGKSDLVGIRLTEHDHLVIAECGNNDSIADRLLVLEMIARKIEDNLYIG